MKIKPLMLNVLLMTSSLGLTACGFHLRGYQSPLVQNIPATQLIFGNSVDDFAVKNALKAQFSQLGIPLVEAETKKSHQTMPSIQVNNIRLQTYQLRGILTEIRLVMSADVTYQVWQTGQWKTVENSLQVQHSYQYDQASVNTENAQSKKITEWLYQNLAQRITDQYVALNLPKTVKPSVQNDVTENKPTE